MKCNECNKLMELKDSGHEPWDFRYWQGYKCKCGNVELIYLTEEEYKKKYLLIEKISENINKYNYMKICPNCNYHYLSEDIQTDTLKCKKCRRIYSHEELYEIKMGGSSFI